MDALGNMFGMGDTMPSPIIDRLVLSRFDFFIVGSLCLALVLVSLVSNKGGNSPF